MTRKLVARALTAPLMGALLLTGLSAAPSQAALGDQLRVSPGFQDTIILATDTFESEDDLPFYTLTLTDVATGADIPVNYGSTEESSSGTYESDYTATTKGPVTIGSTYQAYLRIDRSAHYVCSIYVKEGCYWKEASRSSSWWRFTYTGQATTGTPYAAPAVPPSATATKQAADCKAAGQALKKARKSGKPAAIKRAKKKKDRICF